MSSPSDIKSLILITEFLNLHVPYMSFGGQMFHTVPALRVLPKPIGLGCGNILMSIGNNVCMSENLYSLTKCALSRKIIQSEFYSFHSQ